MKKKNDITRYVREIIKLTSTNNECPNFKSEGEPFWEKNGNPNIFKAHPDAIKGIIYNYNPGISNHLDNECENTFIKKRKR